MGIKKRTSLEKNKAIEALANQLADKPYGEEKEDNTLIRTTISLPSSVLFALEDIAKTNKRKKNDLRSVSAIIRDCIEKTLRLS
jgi:hypothetical protein